MSPIRTQTPLQKLVKHPFAKILATTALVVGGIAPLAQIAQSATTKGLQQDTVEISTKGQLAQATRNHSRQTTADKKQAAAGKKYVNSAANVSRTNLLNQVHQLQKRGGAKKTVDVSKKPLSY